MRRRFRRTTTEEDRDEAPARPSTERDELDFDQLLARELEQTDEPAATDPVSHANDGTVDDAGDGTADEANDEALDDAGDETAGSAAVESDVEHEFEAEPESGVRSPADITDPVPVEPLAGDFWDRYDLARAEAELARVPPAAVVAVVGPLDAVIPVVERCRDRHWMGDCDVFVLTQRRIVADQPGWQVVGQPSDLVAVLEDGGSDFPLLVLDVPCDLPAFVRPLVAHLRERGVGLVHYVLDDDPADEDLATWHGELGRPSVLDLAGSIEAGRVLELVDRGEPVVSVAGQDLSTELLLAFRVEKAAEDSLVRAALTGSD